MSSQVLCRLQLVLDEAGNTQALVVSSTSLAGRGAWICKAGSGDVSGEVGRSNESLDYAENSGHSAMPIRVLASCAVKAKQKKAFARGFRREVPSDVVDAFVAAYC